MILSTSWWKLSKQSHLFRSIHVEKVLTLFGRSFLLYTNMKLSRGMVREAIDRSHGKLVELSVNYIANDELFRYVSEKCSSLRCIRLVSCSEVGGDGLIEMAKRLPQLEELEIVHCSYISKDVFETFGRFCPRLKSCRYNYANYLSRTLFHGVVLTMAQNMPELRYLNLFGNRVTDDDLSAVLDGCPHLESLDLRKCYGLRFAGDLKKKCGNIRVLRLPNDSTDDFEYELKYYSTDDFEYKQLCVPFLELEG